MKRLTFKLSPILLVGDDVDPIDLGSRLTGAFLDLNATFDIGTIEAIGIGRTETEPARPGTCRIDGHTFYAPHYFPAGREVPDICPDHARSEEDAEVQELHRPLFEEVARLTGLHPLIWHSGGGCMTIVIPLATPEPGAGWSAPCYMGLEEGQDDEGRWYGSVSFYATEEQAGGGDGVGVVEAWGNAQYPHQWAGPDR